MLSRISRMSSMTAQFIGGNYFLSKDGPTAPKVYPKLVADHVYHDHAQYSKTFADIAPRQRSSSSNNDPFLGIAEDPLNLDDPLGLNFLDLDQWNRALPEPFDTFEQKPSTINNYVQPQPQPSYAHENYSEHQQSYAQPQQALSNQTVNYDWMEECVPIDFCLSPYSSNGDAQSPLYSPEDVIDKAAHEVDWQAWDRYLNFDDDVKNEVEEDPFSTSNLSDNSVNSQSQSMSLIQNQYSCVKQENDVNIKEELPDEYEDSADVPKSEVRHFNVKQQIELMIRQSGPLEWDEPLCVQKQKSQRMLSRNSNVRMYRKVDWAGEPRSVKKRGVKMKPSVDMPTDRRRAMNREAALRYRERKRMEKDIFHKEINQVFTRNAELQAEEKRLNMEIAKWRKKLALVKL